MKRKKFPLYRPPLPNLAWVTASCILALLMWLFLSKMAQKRALEDIFWVPYGVLWAPMGVVIVIVITPSGLIWSSAAASDIERCSGSAQSQSVVCFWNRHRKCWWNKTLAMPKPISMAMAMSIFECLGSWMNFFGGGQGSPKAGSIPKWSGLPEYMDVTLAWQDEWEAQSQFFFNVFLSKLGCFQAF